MVQVSKILTTTEKDESANKETPSKIRNFLQSFRKKIVEQYIEPLRNGLEETHERTSCTGGGGGGDIKWNGPPSNQP